MLCSSLRTLHLSLACVLLGHTGQVAVINDRQNQDLRHFSYPEPDLTARSL